MCKRRHRRVQDCHSEKLALRGPTDEGLHHARGLPNSAAIHGQAPAFVLPAIRHMQLCVRGKAKTWSADRLSTHPLLEAGTVSAQSARQRRLLRQASVLLPQLAHLRVLPGRRPAQLLDLGHLRTTCSPSHAALEADCRSHARMHGLRAAIQLSLLCLPPLESLSLPPQVAGLPRLPSAQSPTTPTK